MVGPLPEPVGYASLVESREEFLYLRESQHSWASVSQLSALTETSIFLGISETLSCISYTILGSLDSAIWVALRRSICLVTCLSHSSSTAQDSLGRLQSPGWHPEKPNTEHIWMSHKREKMHWGSSFWWLWICNILEFGGFKEFLLGFPPLPFQKRKKTKQNWKVSKFNLGQFLPLNSGK